MSSSPKSSALWSFLGSPPKCQLFLPYFKGPVLLEKNGEATPQLAYRGSMFAERDSRAAFYVHSLVAQVIGPEDIEIQPAVPHQTITSTAFLFGSKSNLVTANILQRPGPQLFRFEFGTNWEIHCSGSVFSIPDPSVIAPSLYDNLDDYGVISRLGTATGSVFIIGGLGGRATEGCGYFLLKNWNDLYNRFGNRDFACVLRFPSPFAIDNSRFVASAESPS
jgi:hypothetical protein